MLHAMRKGAGGWLAKGLLVLLVGSFAVWGIGSDMLGSSVGSNVIEVGSKTVSLGEFQREYQNRLNQFSQYVGTRLTTEQARQFGVAQMTIQQLQTGLLEAERTGELNLGADDDLVRREIQTGPAFKNAVGQFDRFRFQDVLRRNGYSEGEYVNILRGEIKRRQLTGSLALAQDNAPKVMLDTLIAYAGERRSAAYVELLDSAVKNVPMPTDAQLTKFIEENPVPFTAPEYRKAIYLSVAAKDFTDQVDVSDDEIKAEFEGRMSEFNIPGSRGILQMIFEKEEDALAAASKLSGGADFAAVAQEALQLTAKDIDLGVVSKKELLDELQSPVFDAPLNGVTVPVKTILGWHLVKVTQATKESQKTLADVKDILTKDVALRKAADVMFEKTTALQDEFAGGATVQEAGDSTGVKVVKTGWIDASGKSDLNAAIAGLPAAPEFLPELFSKNAQSEIDLTESETGSHFAVAVTEVRKSALKDLSTVKEIAITSWQADWRHTENKKIADSLTEKLKGGATLASLVSATVSDVKTTELMRRSEQKSGFTQAATDKLFDLAQNDFASDANAAKNGYILFSLGQVTPVDRVIEQESIDDLNKQLVSSIQQDIMSQYRGYLEKAIGVSVKENLIREYF